MATKKYSTGPLENNGSQSTSVRVKILNNSDSPIEARVQVFQLNGTKTRIYSETITLPSNSSELIAASVADLLEFEVQIRIRNGNSSVNKVLVSVFGATPSGALNPNHRVLHKELKRI